MTADTRLLPPGIDDERSRAVLTVIERLGSIDLAPLLVNRIDSVPAAALFALAWQFGMTGLAGWDLTGTEERRRELVRRAIEFQRRKGTPWVIKEALKAVEFLEAEVLENYGRARHDGTSMHDGSLVHSAGSSWGDFGVVFGEITDDYVLDDERRALLRGIVESWKRASSRLMDMRFLPSTGPGELPALLDEPMEITFFQIAYHDGSCMHDGSFAHAGAVPSTLEPV